MLPKGDIKIVMGDLNTKLVTNSSLLRHVIKINGVSDRNGNAVALFPDPTIYLLSS